MQSFISFNNATTKYNEPEHELLKPLLNWKLLDMIKKTFQLHAQHSSNPGFSLMNKKHHYPFPVLNVKCISEPAATDAVYGDTPVIDDGSKCAQVFVYTKTLLTDVCLMKSDKQFANILEDNIR